MRDTYLEGKWDEADEVLEWTGFYTGSLVDRRKLALFKSVRL
jgi:hypothetical protein